MDLISIIIPMYNAEKYIEKLMFCLKNQTYKNLEIIVVDDESIDNSLEVVYKCKMVDPRITIIEAKHGGVGNARNIGIEHANGDYITFLDADDYIELDMYEKIMLKIKETKTTLLRCNYTKKDENGKTIPCNNDLLDLSNKLLNNNEIRTKLLAYIFDNKILTYTYLIIAKANLIKNKLKFRTDINMMEDLLFCLDLYVNAEQIYLYDYKCYYYVVNSASITKSRANLLKNYYDTIKVIHILEKFIKDNNIDKNILNQIYYTYSTILIKYLFRTFKEDDEYRMTFEQMINILKDTSTFDIIKNVDFSNCEDEYIKLVGNFIKNQEYDKLYEYAIEANDIKI